MASTKKLTPFVIDGAVAQAKKQGRTVYVSTEGGIQVRANPAGTVVFYYRRRINGALQQVQLGRYPKELSIKDALAKAKEVQKDFDRIAEAAKVAETYTVRQAFVDWGTKQSKKYVTWPKMDLVIRKYITNEFGDLPLADLTAPMLIKAWEPLDHAQMHNTLQKLCSYVRQCAIFAVNTGRVEHIHELTKISQNYVFKTKAHNPAVAPEQLYQLFEIIERPSQKKSIAWILFLLSLYTLGRPGEVAGMRWEWIDPDDMVIVFPAEVMKMRREHRVPISRQLEALLLDIPRVSEWVVPSIHNLSVHTSSETLRIYLRRIGLVGIQTAHGLRSIGRTWMEQVGIPSQVAEACLSHSSANATVKAYLHYDYLQERREAMQRWCDFVQEQRIKAAQMRAAQYLAPKNNSSEH